MAKKKKKQVFAKPSARRPGASPTSVDQRTYTIPDYRLEKPSFAVRQVRKGDAVSYEVSGDLSAPAPPIRESKYLNRQQHIEIYRSAEFISASARKPAPAPLLTP